MSPESAIVRTDPNFIPAFSNSHVAKILVRCEPRSFGLHALRASRVIKRDHLVHYQVQRVAFAVALIRMDGRCGSWELRDRQIVTSPHDKSAGMERAIKPQNNFSRNIAEAKSKLRREHHSFSYGRVGKRLFSAPAHDWQFNPGQRLLAITIWKLEQIERGTQACGLCAQRTICPLLPFQRSATPLGAQTKSPCSDP
jgi:hypothetical protein